MATRDRQERVARKRQLKQDLVFMAGIVKSHGIEYLPLLKRIQKEIDAIREHESDLDWVEQILADAA